MSIGFGADAKVKNDLLQSRDVGESATTEILTTVY